MRYPGGALATVTSSVIDHGEEQQVIFQGQNARISAPWKVYASLPMENGFPYRNEALEAELQADYDKIPNLPYIGHTAEIENVMTALETDTRPFIDGHSGRRTIEIITAIYKSGFEGRTVALPLSPDDAYYTVDGILANVRHFYEKTTSVENFGDEGISVGGDAAAIEH
jgi:predicted dehydrogenase